jgi:hypothetical protein
MAKAKTKIKSSTKTEYVEDSEKSTDMVVEDKEEYLTFDIFTYKDQTLYKDKYGGILDNNANLIGTVCKIIKDNKEVVHYEMFNRVIDTNKDIYKFLK